MPKTLGQMGLKEAKELYYKYNWNSTSHRQMPKCEFSLYIAAKYSKLL